MKSPIIDLSGINKIPIALIVGKEDKVVSPKDA
jgi:hypothetical protein